MANFNSYVTNYKLVSHWITALKKKNLATSIDFVMSTSSQTPWKNIQLRTIMDQTIIKPSYKTIIKTMIKQPLNTIREPLWWKSISWIPSPSTLLRRSPRRTCAAWPSTAQSAAAPRAGCARCGGCRGPRSWTWWPQSSAGGFPGKPAHGMTGWWYTNHGKHTRNYGKSPFLMGKLTINSHFQ